MVCPYLDYRQSDGEHQFDHERAFCEVMNSFVIPIRTDICNDRYDEDHENYCEIYREHEGIKSFPAKESLR